MGKLVKIAGQMGLAGLLGVFGVDLAMAAGNNPDLPISKEISAIESKDKVTVRDVDKMLGHLSLAEQSMDLGMKASALENLQAADTLAKSLMKTRPEIIAKYRFKYGKMGYTVGVEERDYYIPVAEDIGFGAQFANLTKNPKAPKIEAQRLDIVRTTLQLNLNSVQKAIAEAKTQVNASNFTAARTSLEGVFNDALASVETVTNPVWSVWGNLVLAQQFINAKDYSSARFSLTAAQSELSKLESDGSLAQNATDAKALRTEIDSLNANLKSNDPTAMGKVHAALNRWTQKVKTWL